MRNKWKSKNTSNNNLYMTSSSGVSNLLSHQYLDNQNSDEDYDALNNLEPQEDQKQRVNQSLATNKSVTLIKLAEQARIMPLVNKNYHIYAHGPPSCGKSTLSKMVLQNEGAAYRHINCMIYGDQTSIVSSILGFLKLHMNSSSTRFSGKFDQIIQFFRLFEGFKSHRGSDQKYYVILNNFHNIKQGNVLLTKLVQAFNKIEYFVEGIVLRLYIIDRTADITLLLDGFAEVRHDAFTQTEMKNIIIYKLKSTWQPAFPDMTQHIVQKLYKNFKDFGNTVDYFIKAYFLTERQLQENYIQRAQKNITVDQISNATFKSCLDDLSPFLQDDKYQHTFPTREQILRKKIEREKENKKKKMSQSQSQQPMRQIGSQNEQDYQEMEDLDQNYNTLTEFQGAMILASYFATYLPEKSDLYNFASNKINEKYRKQSKKQHRHGKKAKANQGATFGFLRFQAIFNYMLNLTCKTKSCHPEQKFEYQSLRALSLMGQFLRGNLVVQTKQGSYRSLITHQNAAKIGLRFNVDIDDFVQIYNQD